MIFYKLPHLEISRSTKNKNCLSFNSLTDMSTIRSNRKFEEPVSVVFGGIILLLVANCKFVGEFMQA